MAVGDLITLDEFKVARRIQDARDDAEIVRCITAASEWLGQETGRQFWQEASATARKFRPSGRCVQYVDDFSTTTGLVVAESGVTLTLDTDFFLEPLNGKGPGGATVAYYQLHKFNGMVWLDDNDGPSLTVTARWGWASTPGPVKQAVIEIVGELMATRDSTFGVIGIDAGTAVRLRRNTHVAVVVGSYERADRAPRFGLA